MQLVVVVGQLQFADDPLHAQPQPQVVPPSVQAPPVVKPMNGVSELFDTCHVSPPRKIKPFPAAGVVDAQVFEQFGIPGACSQGVLSLVPLFVSEPLAEMK